MSLRRLSSPFTLAFVSISALLASGCGATKTIGGDDSLDSSTTGDPDGGATFDIGGGDGLFDPDGGAVFQDITLDPPNATIYIDTSTTPATPATVTYKATLNNSDGTTKDVSSTVSLVLDDTALGSFSGPTFTSIAALPGTALGVTTVVTGTAEGKVGKANLTIVQIRKGGDHRDFFFVVPYMGPPSPDRDVLKFGTNIKQVDVAFVVDTTGSMSSSITSLTASLSGTLMPALIAAIPSVGLAAIDVKDSDDGDPWAVKVSQVVTTDVTKAKSAVSAMSASGGGDEPEAQEEGMLYALDGKAIPSSPPLAAHTPAAGTSGGVDFRPGSLPVVVNITDAHWHDKTTIPWSGGSDTVNSTILTSAFTTANARFIGITDMHYASFETTPFPLLQQPQQLAAATKSYVPPSAFGGTTCPTGLSGASETPSGPGGTCLLSFQINNGVGIGDSVVKAIQAISVGSTFDVTAVPSNDPTNADGVDATKFIKALRAMDEGDPAEKCPTHAAKDTDGDGIKDTFIAVVVGTPVCFEVLPQMNTTVKPKTVAQFFNAFIDVLGMPGSVKLDKRTVVFEVPPRDIGVK